MGLGGISIWQLLIVLVIVVLIFGTKKLKNMGGDLGGAVKNFKDSINEGKEQAEQEDLEEQVGDDVEQLENKVSEAVDKVKDDNKTSS